MTQKPGLDYAAAGVDYGTLDASKILAQKAARATAANLALHDAAEMAPHMPVVMMFASSSNGLSHCKEEDTPEPHLEASIRAYLRLVEKTIVHVSSQA